MKKITEITTSPKQEFIITHRDIRYLIGLRYVPTVYSWLLSVKNETTGEVYWSNLPIAVNVPLGIESGREVFFFFQDNSGLNQDAYLLEDFGFNGRVDMYLADERDNVWTQ